MAKVMNSGGGVQMAAAAAQRIDVLLTETNKHLKRLADIASGKYYFELEGSVNLAAEENSGTLTLPMIPQGYVFIPQRIAVQAPKGSRLQLFSNSVSAANFLEVIANVQEYSEGILGPWQVYGPCVILAKFTKAEAATAATVVLSGMLIPREPAPMSHRP